MLGHPEDATTATRVDRFVRWSGDVEKAHMPRLFDSTDGTEFKRQFAIQFLASYAASIYDDCCDHGEFDRINRLPVEDAEDLADKAFEHWLDVFGSSEPRTVQQSV